MTDAPTRTDQVKALGIFIGDWTAEGTSFGGEASSGQLWFSIHTAAWHTGNFFIIQDERARIDGSVFDTHAVIGVDSATGAYFMRSVENHGFDRDYRMERDGDVWRVIGDTERATITFSDGGRTQTHRWEWKPAGTWVPLCDRAAKRTDEVV